MTDQPGGPNPELTRAEMMEAIWKQTRLTGHVIERLRHEVDHAIDRAHRELVPDWEGPAPWLDPAAGPQGDVSELVRAEMGLLIPALVKKEVDAQFRHFTEKLKARMQSAERPLAQKLGAARSRKGR